MTKEVQRQKLLHDLRGMLSPLVNLVPLVNALLECKEEDKKDLQDLVKETCNQIDESGDNIRKVLSKLSSL